MPGVPTNIHTIHSSGFTPIQHILTSVNSHNQRLFRRSALLHFLLMLCSLCFASDLFAANCGGLHQKPCSVFSGQPACQDGLEQIPFKECVPKKSPQALKSITDLLNKPRPNYCGRHNQPPCTVDVFIPSCEGDLIEFNGQCKTHEETLYRANCGNQNQRPCNVLERIPSCNAGLAEIRGSCLRLGECGASGQRPCEIGERVPSCNANLKENFKQNICVGLRPGETPFLGGVSSLADYYGDSIKSVCKETLGNLNLNDNTTIGMGAECSKMVFVGAGCEYLASALGADAAASIGNAADTPRQIADSERQFNLFKAKVDQAYNNGECTQFAEKLAPATQYGRSNQMQCPAGQFWDPNGNCYSCPAGYTRTLESVTSNRACVDKPAGEIARSSCAVFKAATQEFAKSAACAAEVLSSGAFMNQQVDFNTAGREFCMATGEFGYAITSIMIPSKSPQQKAQQITTSLDKFIQTIKRGYRVADNIKTKFNNAATIYDQSSNMASKFNNLINCRDDSAAAPVTMVSAPPSQPTTPAMPILSSTAMVAIPGTNYEISRYEVTQGEWQSVMGNNPSQFTNCGNNCPVENVSWNEIQIFLQTLNNRTGMQYRLPTNAEWKYACYGGSQTTYCGGDNIDAVSWYAGNSSNNSPTHPVGQKQSNGYGLYDMSGNVLEYASDSASFSCIDTMLRGGSGLTAQADLGATRLFMFCGGEDTNTKSNKAGFRLARTLQ